MPGGAAPHKRHAVLYAEIPLVTTCVWMKLL